MAWRCRLQAIADCNHRLAAAQGLRRGFTEPNAVFHRKAPHMGETVPQGDLGDALLRFGAAERLANSLVARVAQVAHRRDSLEIAEMLDQGAARDPARRDDFGESDFSVEVGLDVLY